jgi:hypothetical protein
MSRLLQDVRQPSVPSRLVLRAANFAGVASELARDFSKGDMTRYAFVAQQSGAHAEAASSTQRLRDVPPEPVANDSEGWRRHCFV